jgi:hypothetical protein
VQHIGLSLHLQPHGNDTSTRAQSKNAQALQELEILYSKRDQVLQRGGVKKPSSTVVLLAILLSPAADG